MNRTRIIALFLTCGPSAIGRFVVAVVVDAVKSFPGRTLAHVFEKVPKVVPSVTNRDSATSVPSVSMMCFGVAPSAHLHPRIMGAGTMHVVPLFFTFVI